MRIFLMLVMGLSLVTTADAQTPKNWPCDNVYNPTIPLAAVWQGPSIEERLDTWWESQYLEKAMTTYVALFEDDTLTQEEASQLVASFAAQIPRGEREEALLDLFAAVYSSLLSRYKEQLSSILRFVDRQGKVSERTSQKAAELRELRRNGVASSDEKYQTVEAEMEWNVRVFDERNRLTPYICDEPVFIKQQLGFRARAILSHLS